MSTHPDSDAIADGRDETPNERADRNWDELMQELRVMQTGTQILTGFLLAVAFQQRFTELDELQRDVYIVLVALAATATVLSLAPVGLHRALFGRRRKPDLVRIAARIVRIDLFVIGVLTAGVTTLIVDFTVNRTAGIVTLVITLLAAIALWVWLPRAVGAPRSGDPLADPRAN